MTMGLEDKFICLLVSAPAPPPPTQKKKKQIERKSKDLFLNDQIRFSCFWISRFIANQKFQFQNLNPDFPINPTLRLEIAHYCCLLAASF